MELILTSQSESRQLINKKDLDSKDKFDIHSVLDVLIKLLENENCVIYTRIAALKWLSNLLIDLPISEFETRVQRLISVCFARLSDENDFVVDMDLCVIARIALHPKIYEQLLKDLLKKFYNNSHLLHFRGKLILTKLCQLLDCKEIYCFLSNLILKEYFGSIVKNLDDIDLDKIDTKSEIIAEMIDLNNRKKKETKNRKNSKNILSIKISNDNEKNNSEKNNDKSKDSQLQTKTKEQRIKNESNSKSDEKDSNEQKTEEKRRSKKLMIEELFENEGNNKTASNSNNNLNVNEENLFNLSSFSLKQNSNANNTTTGNETSHSRLETKIARRLAFVHNIVRLI